MARLRWTSPGAILLMALVLAGGILLLDVFCLKPYAEHQLQAALRERALGAERIFTQTIESEQEGLSRVAEVAVAFLERQQIAGRDLGSSIEELGSLTFSYSGVDGVWTRDGQRNLTEVWKKQDSPTEFALSQEVADSIGHARGGLIGCGFKLAIFINNCLPSRKGSHEENHLILVRFLDEGTLQGIGSMLGGSMIFIPLGKEESDFSGASRKFWYSSADELAVSWPIYNAAGQPLGHARADFPVVQIQRQASAARRVVLIILSLSIGLMLLVIMVMHMFIAGPVVRLLRRLQNIDSGDTRQDLTADLHGEPLMLARRLESAFDKLAHISKTDQLTGLANRRHFEEVFERFYVQSKRYNRPLSLMMIDVDYFKAVNDTAGHQAGDELLKQVATGLEKACRQADLPARIGGDEFAVLLPETASSDAALVAQRIREYICEKPFHSGALEFHISLSIGLTDLNAGEIDSPEAMSLLADRALYAAKEQGRNCLVQACDIAGTNGKGFQEESGRVNVLHKKLAGLDNRFQDVFLQVMQEIMKILEQRDPNMADHARKVQHYALLIAQEMELPPRILKRLEIAAMLHDIGMTTMPDEILLNPGELTEEQMKIMRRHSLLSVRIMEGMEFLEQEIPTVRYHHERFDGTGYPEGLSGSAIPLTARILSVADSFEAMTSSRTFRHPLSRVEALGELKKASGTQFDPVVLEVFLNLADRLGDRLMAYEESATHFPNIVENQPCP